MIRREPGAGPDEACPTCAEGDVWYSPSGSEIWFCADHARIVDGAPGWRRAGVQVSSHDPQP